MAGVRAIWFYANNIINSARQMVNEQLEALDLGSAEGNVLLHLLTSGEVLRQEDLAEQLEISKPAISRALTSLEQKGYVERRTDRQDRRVRRVFLSEKAHEIGPELEKIYEHVFSVASHGISDAEIQWFIELFQKVSASFTEAREKMKNGG